MLHHSVSSLNSLRVPAQLTTVLQCQYNWGLCCCGVDTFLYLPCFNRMFPEDLCADFLVFSTSSLWASKLGGGFANFNFRSCWIKNTYAHVIQIYLNSRKWSVYFCYCSLVFGPHSVVLRALLLALPLEIISGKIWGTIQGIRDQTQVGPVQASALPSSITSAQKWSRLIHWSFHFV